MRKIVWALALLALSTTVAVAEPEVMILLVGGDAKYTVPKDRVLLIENVYYPKKMELRKQLGRTDSIHFEIETTFWTEDGVDGNACRLPLKIPAGWTLSTPSKPRPMYVFAVLLKPSELSAYLSKTKE